MVGVKTEDADFIASCLASSIHKNTFYTNPNLEVISKLLFRLEWQVLVPVFMSLIVWLEANTFTKVHGLHSLT